LATVNSSFTTQQLMTMSQLEQQHVNVILTIIFKYLCIGRFKLKTCTN